MSIVTATPASTSSTVEWSEKTYASINLEKINAPVSVSVADQPESNGANKTAKIAYDYSPMLSVERSINDDANLETHTRAHYVAEFKRGAEKTARATLETCRVVYEASRTLDSYEFQNFCREIGYRDNSSTIRKFIAIGKVYPRFIQYADQMPSGWTAIYQITQIPADTFERWLSEGHRLNQLKGKHLSDMLAKTQSLDDLSTVAKFDSQAGGLEFAKVVAIRKFDDVDWRAFEKAMNELEARLPVRFVIPKQLKKFVDQRRLRLYDGAKQKYADQHQFKPDTWDLGDEANAVLPRAEPEVATKA